MKKLLILGSHFELVEKDFPPYVSVGAVLSLPKYGLRPYNWFKYLKEFEVESIVLNHDF